MMTPILLVPLAPTLIIGLIFLAMPRVRAGILFGVSVPVDFAESEAAEKILTRYRTHVLAVLFAVMVASGAAVMSARPALLVAITIAQMPLLCWA